MNNIQGGIALLASSSLQQYSLVHFSQYSPYVSFLSLCFDLLALFYLPLSIYILLGSLHVLLRSFYQKNLNSSNLFILAGCIIAVVFCEEQKNLVGLAEIDHTVNYLYYSWMLISLFINLGMRRYGFWVGKTLIESSIPSQLATFGYGSLKIVMLNLDLLLQSKQASALEIANFSLISIFSLSLSTSFLKYMSNETTQEIAFLGYYLWLLCYCFPIGITLVNPGVPHSLSNIYFLLISCTLITIGVYLLTYKVPQDSSKKNGKKKLEEEEETLI